MIKRIIPIILILLVMLNMAFAVSYSKTRGVHITVPSSYYTDTLGMYVSFQYVLDGGETLEPFSPVGGGASLFDKVIKNTYTYDGDVLIPYDIHSCYIFCDSNNPYADTIDILATSSNKPYSFYFNTYISAYCKYPASKVGQNITVSLGCRLVPDENYINAGDFTSDYVTDFGFSSDNVVNKCSTDLYDCYDIYEGEDCVGTSTDEWGSSWTTCSNIIVDTYEFSFTFNGDDSTLTVPSGGSVDEGDPEDLGDGDGNVGGDPDGAETEKLFDYDDLESNAKKKNIVMVNLIYIMEIFFSIILIFFYIYELAITIFVFAIWIPGIFKGLVKIINSMGGK